MDSEFADVKEEAPDDRPLNERLVDKNWKKRQQAYEDLKKMLSAGGEPSLFSTYVEFLPKMLADINATCLDLAVEVITLFADLAPTGFMNSHSDFLFPNIVDKCFGTKATLITKAQGLLLKLMEVTDPTSCTLYLISRLGDKKPKVPSSSLEVIRMGIVAFGAKPFPVKEILASLGAVFNSVNAPARDEAMSLLVELHKWVGKATLKVMEELRPAQKETFEQLIAENAKLNIAPAPTQTLRRDKGKESIPGAPSGGSKEGVDVAPTRKASIGGDMDARDFVDEVDLMKALKATEYGNLVTAEKWDEQAKALQLVIDAIGATPKLKKGADVSEVITACKNFFRAGHINVQMKSLKVLSLLADGLRSDYASSARSLNETILLKFKEKKLIPECISYLCEALKYSIELSSLLDSSVEMIKSKKNPPHARIGLLELMSSVLTDQTSKVASEHMRVLVDTMIECSDDSDPKIRELCGSNLFLLTGLVKAKGKGAADTLRVLTALEVSAPKLFAKFKSALSNDVENATPTSSSSSSSLKGLPSMDASEGKTAPASRVVSTKKPLFKKKTAGETPPSGADTTTTTKDASGSKDGPVAAPKRRASAKENKVDDDLVEDLTINASDAEALLETLGIEGWTGIFQLKFSSDKWQDKVEGFEAIAKSVEASSEGGKYSAALASFVGAKTSGFKIINMNVLKAVLQIAVAAAKNLGSQPFSRAAAWEFIKNVFEKLSDKKVSELIVEMLMAFSESTSPSFVFKRCKNVLAEAKSPAVHETFLSFLKAAIKEFGAVKFPVALVGSLCHEELENKVAGVRTAAVEVLGALYHQLGPKVQAVAVNDSLKAQVKIMIEAEFSKVGYDASAATAVVRMVKGEEAGGGSDNAGGGISRMDLGKELGNTYIAELASNEGKSSWQVRKTAMETLIAACERSGHFVENTKFVADVLRCLKDRMDDSQANNKPIAASAIGHLVSSLEIEPASKLTKLTVAAALIGGFGDIKKGMRDATVLALDVLVTMNKGGLNADPSMLAAFVPPIADMIRNPVGRLELLTWINTHSYALKADIVNDWVPPLVVALQDKVAAVRTLAETILLEMSSRGLVSKAVLEKPFKDLPASAMRSLQSSHTKIMTSHGASKVSATAAASADNLIKVPSEDVEPAGPLRRDSFREPGNPTLMPSSSSLPPRDVPRSVDAIDEREIKPPPKFISARSEVPPPPEAAAVLPSSGDKLFLKRILKAVKLKRLETFAKSKWPEKPGETEFQGLQVTWEPFLSAEFSSVLFPSNRIPGAGTQDLLVGGIIGLLAQIENPLFMQHTDLVLCWCSCGLSMRESPVAMLKLMQLLIAVFDKMRLEGVQMHESEVSSILPQIISLSGHPSERHTAALKQAISAAAEVTAPSRLCTLLIEGLASSNKRSRHVCLELMRDVVGSVGVGALGRTGVCDISLMLDSGDSDASLKQACLDLLSLIYVSLGQDLSKLYKLIGGALSASSLALIEEKVTAKEESSTGIKPEPTTPPGERSGNDSPPFKLNLSSPKTEEDRKLCSSSPERGLSSDGLMGASSNSDEALNGIFVDIIKKIDALLSFDQSSATSSSLYPRLHEDAKDYVKMLLSNVKGTWHRDEMNSCEDMENIATQINPLVRRILLCIQLAFAAPPHLSGAYLTIDVTLASAAVSTLYAFVEKTIFVQRFSEQTVSEVAAVIASALVDKRLYQKTNEASQDACKLLERGLNLVLLKLSETANRGIFICVLLRLFTQSLMDKGRVGDAATLLTAVSSESSKVLMRLIMRLSDLESKSGAPFCPPSVDVSKMLFALHAFFATASNELSDETLFRVGKSIVVRLVQASNASSVLKILKANKLGIDCLLAQMVARIGGIDFSSPSIYAPQLLLPSSGRSSSSSPVGEVMNGELGGIIDEITSAKDKDGPIKKLYAFLLANPEVDVQVYFQRVSVTFRRFVLENLARIEANSIAGELQAARDKRPLIARFYKLIQSNPHLDGNKILMSLPPELRRFTLDQLSELEATALQAGPPKSAASEPLSTDSAALKLLDGLRKREYLVPKASEITKKRSSLTPRLERVMDSLESLNASLSTLGTSATGLKDTSDEDADLASRLSRLRASHGR